MIHRCLLVGDFESAADLALQGGDLTAALLYALPGGYDFIFILFFAPVHACPCLLFDLLVSFSNSSDQGCAG